MLIHKVNLVNTLYRTETIKHITSGVNSIKTTGMPSYPTCPASTSTLTIYIQTEHVLSCVISQPPEFRKRLRLDNLVDTKTNPWPFTTTNMTIMQCQQMKLSLVPTCILDFCQHQSPALEIFKDTKQPEWITLSQIVTQTQTATLLCSSTVRIRSQ